MPALPLVPNVVKVVATWTIGIDTQCQCVFHYQYTGGAPAGADCVSIASHMTGAYVAAITSLLPNSTVLTKVDVLDLSSATGAEGASTVNIPGTGGTTPVPASNCFLMSYQVALRYRGGHPRTYFPGMPATAMSNAQNWLGTSVTNATTAWKNWLQSISGFTAGSTSVASQCMVSYVHGGNPRVTPAVYPLASWNGKPGIATQRRRLRAH